MSRFLPIKSENPGELAILAQKIKYHEYTKCLEIPNNKLDIIKNNGKRISLKEITNICKRQYTDFEVKYIVFESLRDKGYVVSPGIKFGCDFAVYIHGPGI